MTVGFGLLALVGVSSRPLVVGANIMLSLGFGVVIPLTVDCVMGAAPARSGGAAVVVAG